MDAKLPGSLFSFASFAFGLTLACGVACTNATTAPSPETADSSLSACGGSSSGGSSGGGNACTGKVCGQDCTPDGSDEPFNCNASGQCVATGQPLGCKQCPEFLGDCAQGTAPADLDGDGCIDGCKPVP